MEGFLLVQARSHKQRIQLNPSNYQKRLLNSAFFQRLFLSVAQPSGVWNEIEYPSTRSHPTAPLGMHFTGTKKKTSTCINCLARFCQCHFSFAHLAIFLFGPTFFCQKALQSQAIEIPGGRSTKIGGRTATWPHLVSVDLDDVDAVALLGTIADPYGHFGSFLKMRIFRTSQGGIC